MTIHRGLAVLTLASALGLAGCGSTSPTAPTATSTSPSTVTWTTHIGPGGTASRSFKTTVSGSVTATLQAAGVSLGLGIGIPGASGVGCRLAASTMSQADQNVDVTAAVDGGDYCVEVFDAGVLTGEVAFVVQIVHP